MDISISSISRLDEGIAIGNTIIGVAQVSKIKLEPGETLESYKDSGMVFDIVKEVVDGEEIAKFDFSDLKTARNYVLYAIESDGEYAGKPVVLENVNDITDIFKLPAEEAETMMKNLPALALQRQLCIIPYTNPNRGEDGIMFAPNFDVEIVEDLLEDRAAIAASKISSMMNDPRHADYRTNLISHSFIKMFLYTLAETGQKRYNYYNSEVPLQKIAKELMEITYFQEGELHTPSVSDIEGYLNLIKRLIPIQTQR